MRDLWDWLDWIYVSARHLIRPYDRGAGRRRWRWQRRSSCGGYREGER